MEVTAHWEVHRELRHSLPASTDNAASIETPQHFLQPGGESEAAQQDGENDLGTQPMV
jgi:hypothetical protein